ncbi:MAG: alpha/beta fold hydrolase [Bacillota bacterium]
MTTPPQSPVNQPPKRRLLSRWLTRLAFAFPLLIVLLALAGVAYQAIASALDARRYPPPGRLVDIGGYRLHINTTGTGSPTVILDAGLSDCSLNWSLVQPEVAKFTRVCSYDRAGVGWSDPGPLPRSSGQIVGELHTLLKNAGIPAPYILVGHSFGGYNVRLFAQKYPNEVAGLVLLDSAHEDQASHMPQSLKRLQAQWPQALHAQKPWTRLGIVRLFYTSTNPRLPASMQPIDRALRSRTSFVSAICSECDTFEESAIQLKQADPLPQVPLAVLTAGDLGKTPPPGIPPEDWTQWESAWTQMQNDLAGRCSNSIHTTLPNSTHLIPLDQPKAVVDAIRTIVEQARAQQSPTH